MDRNMPIAAIMTTDLITLHPEDSLNIVERTFEAKPFHHIPIVDTSNEICGMISKTDLLRLSAIRNEFTETEFRQIKVKDFMTPDVVVADPECTLIQLASIFNENKFHAVPVVSGEKVVGIVTTHDVLNAVFDLEPIKS